MMFLKYKILLYSVLFTQFFITHCDAIFSQHIISFIIPCYNCADKVSKAIDSIYAQNMPCPFEVICCDDGSTDNTVQVLLECKKRYRDLKLVQHARNKGAGAAANTCVRYSTGDLLFRLDADNILPDSEHNVINRLLVLLDKTNCDAAMVEHMVLFENNSADGKKEIKQVMTYQAPDYVCDLQHCITQAHDPAMSGNFLMTRAAYKRVGGYPEDHGSDTFRFGFALYAIGGKVAILKDSFYWHFYNPNGYWWREQKTGNNDAKALETVLVFKHLFTRSSQVLLEQAARDRQETYFTLLHKNLLKLV